MYIAGSGVQTPQKKFKESFRSPARLPELAEGEQVEQYITALKTDAPVEAITLLGMSFQKRILPPEASLAENSDKPFDYGVMSCKLSDRQVKALWKRSEETIINVGRKKNYNYTKDNGQKEFFESVCAPAKDFLILCKISEYNPLQIIEQRKPQSFKSETENARAEMYKCQGKRRKGDK